MTPLAAYRLLAAAGTPDDLAAHLAHDLAARWADYARGPYLMVAHRGRVVIRIDGSMAPGPGYTIVPTPAS